MKSFFLYKWFNVPMIQCLYRHSLTPSIYQLPPQHFYPLIERHLCPFAVGPPRCAEFLRVLRSGGAELVLRQVMAEDHSGATSMVVGRDDEHAMDTERLQASVYVVDLREGRETIDRTHRDTFGVRKFVHIVLRNIDQLCIVDAISLFGIQENMGGVSLMQQLDGIAWADVRFP